jgi:hypothetical protein
MLIIGGIEITSSIKLKTENLPSDPADQSLIEAAIVGSPIAVNLDHLAKTATVSADMTAEVTDGSIISRMLSKTSDTSSYNLATDSLEMLSDKLGEFSGDGGNNADDSVKSILDIINTAVTSSLADTQIRVIAAGAKTIGSGFSKYLSIDSGTNGAEILGIVIKGVVQNDWGLGIYVPAADGVATQEDEDIRESIEYTSDDYWGGMLTPFAIPFNCFLVFGNEGMAENAIDQVQIVYRSRAPLTVAWEE